MSASRRLARSRCAEGALCLVEVGVLPCGGGLPTLYGGLGFPVRGFEFHCTGKHAALHGGCILPTRRVWVSYTEIPFSLHGGNARGTPLADQKWWSRVYGDAAERRSAYAILLRRGYG